MKMHGSLGKWKIMGLLKNKKAWVSLGNIDNTKKKK